MYKNYIKRLLDIIVSLIALPFFCIAFIFIAPTIYLSDKGPVFYNAERLGKDGKLFKMYKFRSMKVNAPDIRNEDGSTYNSQDDPRVTGIGKVLRKTSLDEIPQILNVLVGDMSIIGPRPNLPPEDFSKLSDIEKERVKVRPGITGYNQAFFRNTVSSEEKFKNDVYYVDNISFAMDLKVIFRTVYTVIKCEKVYAVEQSEFAKEKEAETITK